MGGGENVACELVHVLRTVTVVTVTGDADLGGDSCALGEPKLARSPFVLDEDGGKARDPKTLFWILVASLRVFSNKVFGGVGPDDPTAAYCEILRIEP